LLTDQTLAAWYDEHGARLYRYALLILADRAAAEDAVQEAFVRLATALRRRDVQALTFGYLATVVRNECYTALRKRRRRGGETLPLIESAAPGTSEEERMIVDAALKALPPEQREVIHLKIFEGLTFQEIADRCAISINTAGSRYRYAADALRRTLARGTGR
jgi:RNA polymerase sigma-70 factor (ECF subfamily)